MKAVTLAGGLGTGLSDETGLRPKLMVEIGGRPMIWHIMKICLHFEVIEFVICRGYKGDRIREHLANCSLHMSDVTTDMRKGGIG